MKNKPADQGWLQVGRLGCQRGQSMVELLVIVPVMLLLISATIQFALIYHAKITLNYAAYEGTRAGSLTCSDQFQDYNNRCDSSVTQFEAVREGFARGLAPLYSYFEPEAEKRYQNGASNQVEAFQQGRARIYKEFQADSRPIRIERLNPTKPLFSRFAVDGVIPNDNLMYRSGNDVEGLNNLSIQDANVLHLRFTYWYPLYVPVINKMIFSNFICCKGQQDDSSCRWATDPICQGDEPRIPLTATAAMRMQAPVENSSGYDVLQ